MRRWHSFSVCRRLAPLNRRPVSCSLVHSSAALATTASPAHFDSQVTTAPTYNASSTSSTSSTVAARYPIRLQHGQTLTVLHTARELVARILPPESIELSFWHDVLRDVSNEISRSSLTSKGDNVTIVVYPVDKFSGGESLVSALLQDPFSPEEESVQISRRWEGHEQNTRLDFGYATSPIGDTKSNHTDGPSSASHVMRLSSSFLASIPSPVRLTELRPTRELSQDNLRLFYTAHIPIILLNPLTTPLTTLFSHTPSSKQTILPFPLPPHALLLITSPSSISTSSSIPPTVFELGVGPDRVFLVDPDRALSSISALRANPLDVLHVQRYSDDAVASGLSRLKRQLQSVPTATQKGDALASTAISVLYRCLDGVESELRQATTLVRTLRGEASREREEAHRAVFGPAPERVLLDDRTPSKRPSASAHKVVGTTPARHSDNKVRAAMALADDSVLPVLDSMTWWRVLWEPDEVGWRMRQATRDAWVGPIADTLLPALAALASTQSAHASRALSRVSSSTAAPLPPALHSPLLQNALHQLLHAPSFTVAPRALLRPIENRIARLDAGTTGALARAAQVLLLRVAGSFGVGVGAAVVNAGMLAQGVGEAAGAGLLIAAAGVRWAIGRWDKARKMWKADWVRVKEAAERDVEAELDETLEKQVLIVPVRAAEGIEGIVAKREDEMGQLRREVDKLNVVISDSQNSAHRNPDHS